MFHPAHILPLGEQPGGQQASGGNLGIVRFYKNLTNTPLKFTEGPGPNRVIQREFYDATLQFGGVLNF